MNRKGFTLTELLVVVVILGIISGLSIPLIRNLTSTFEKKKYQSYADSVLAASKVYNDSYSEDLFGHNEYGCAYIPYEKLVEKNLIKNIQIDKVTCNSQKTYVRVMKVSDKYGYSVFLTCGEPTKDGKVKKVTVTIPDNIPAMNNDVCTGVDESNLLITAVDAQTNGKYDKNRKKAKIKIESGTGINNNIIIYAKWSKQEDDHTNTGFEKISFKVKGDQEKSILNGEMISTLSNELVSPVLTGDYYLILRVDRLEDLYGHQWKNKEAPNTKYISFGPFKLDSTAPEVTTNVYKCDSSFTKTGSIIATKKHKGAKTTFDLESMDLTVNGWATSKNFPYGVCFEFNITDDSALNNSTWQWNERLLKKNATGYKEFPADYKSVEPHDEEPQATVTKSLTANGHRYAKITSKDIAGNKTELYIDLKLDNTGPDTLTITNSKENTWTKDDLSLVLTSKDKDEINSIGSYYYTYKSDATDYTGTTDADASTKWVKLNGTTSSGKFTTAAWNKTMNKKVYIKSADAVDNISSVTKNTTIKIDKTKPVVTVTNDYEGVWATTSVSLKLSARDNVSGIEESGIDEYYYSYNADATNYSGQTDADANTKWVRLNGGSEKTSFTTETIWSTTMAKNVYIKVKDKVGNYSDAVSTLIKVDKNPPRVPTICSSIKPNKWGNSIIHTVESSDDTAGYGLESGISKFQYRYGNTGWTDSEEYTESSNYWNGDIGNDDITLPGNSSNESHLSQLCQAMGYNAYNCPYLDDIADDSSVIRPGSGSGTGSNDSSYGYSTVPITTNNSNSGSNLIGNGGDDDDECSWYTSMGYECPTHPSIGYSVSVDRYDYSECAIVETETNTIHRHRFNTNMGETTVYWRACDNAGNCSEEASTLIRLDTKKPSCKTTVSGTTVTFKCTDTGGSGCSGTNPYSVEDPNGNGVSHSFSDRAGNSKSCSKGTGEVEEDDDDEGGGGGGGSSSCEESCTSSYVYQGGGSQTAASCNSSCGTHGGFITGEGSSGATYVTVTGGGGYWKCTAFAEGQVGASQGCCNCRTNCTETCS